MQLKPLSELIYISENDSLFTVNMSLSQVDIFIRNLTLLPFKNTYRQDYLNSYYF